MNLLSKFTLLSTAICILHSHQACSQATSTPVRRSDAAGPFRLSYRMPIERHRTVMSKMEDFVWSHWKAHKPGRLSYRYVSIEGAPTDFLLFLEYSGEDRWRIRIETKQVRTDFGHPSHRLILRNTNFVYNLRRVRTGMITGDSAVTIPNDEELRSGMYVLEFLNDDGSVLGRWDPDSVTQS